MISTRGNSNKTSTTMGITKHPQLKSHAIITLLCNVPDSLCANQLAHTLVETQLAACVNILPAVTSVYRWQDKIETATEIPLLIKTTENCFSAIQTKVCELHPYEVPELIAFRVEQGLPAYLAWVRANVAEDACGGD